MWQEDEQEGDVDGRQVQRVEDVCLLSFFDTRLCSPSSNADAVHRSHVAGHIPDFKGGGVNMASAEHKPKTRVCGIAPAGSSVPYCPQIFQPRIPKEAKDHTDMPRDA